MVYGHLFHEASDEELASLKKMGQRWKQYEKEGKWVYEQHPFWCTGYTFWDLKSEAPDLFLNLADSELVIFKGSLKFLFFFKKLIPCAGDLNFRKLWGYRRLVWQVILTLWPF
jgi:hypothetical protein